MKKKAYKIYHVLIDDKDEVVFEHWNKQDCYHYQNHIRPDTRIRTIREEVA